jgi:hypothetical protein
MSRIYKMKIKIVTAHYYIKKEHKTGINREVLIASNETSCIFPPRGIFGGQNKH